MKKIIITIVLFFLVTLFFILYFKEGVMPVKPKSKESKIFVIPKGSSVTQIARNLEKEGLIRNKLVFYFVVKQLGIEKKIQAGDFRLSPSMNAYEIAQQLTKGTLDVWVTIIEGLRKEEIAQIISKELGLPEIEFIKKAKEGYLFPDTYLIPKEATIEMVLDIFYKNFNRRYDQKLRELTRKKGLTEEEVIIIASLVEKEGKYPEDRPLIASVILNRLRIGMKLDIDATVQYALGYQENEKTWWKKNLTLADLEIDSEYNTYRNKGLPPGPIANPGLSAIKAVLEAPKTEYLYYLADKTGKTHFAKTFEEHQRNIEKYLR